MMVWDTSLQIRGIDLIDTIKNNLTSRVAEMIIQTDLEKSDVDLIAFENGLSPTCVETRPSTAGCRSPG